jgi:hypothetical protein
MKKPNTPNELNGPDEPNELNKLKEEECKHETD